MQVCSGLCCVRPLAGEDRHMGVPMSVHQPFGYGTNASDGTHSRRRSDVPRAHLGTSPAYPQYQTGLPVWALALSFLLEVLHCYNKRTLTPPAEVELSLYNGVVQAF